MDSRYFLCLRNFTAEYLFKHGKYSALMVVSSSVVLNHVVAGKVVCFNKKRTVGGYCNVPADISEVRLNQSGAQAKVNAFFKIGQERACDLLFLNTGERRNTAPFYRKRQETAARRFLPALCTYRLHRYCLYSCRRFPF